MPTLDDVAREVGVHPSTVSRALNPQKAVMVNPQTRQAVEQAARKLGYRPHMVARGLQSGRTATVGVIAADLGNPFVTPIIHGITESLEVAEMMPVVAETQDEHDRFARILDHMLSRRVDAVVAAATRAGDRRILEDASRIAPVVIAGRPLPGSTLPQAVLDDGAGARMAAEHLHQLGHRHVVQLRGPLDVANFQYRAEAFTQASRDLGLREVELPEIGTRPILEEGRRLMGALLDRGEGVPSAVFAHNDLMAMGALAVLREAGRRVPQDVSLIGYNDLPMMDLVDPPLTTIRYRSREIGLAAGRLVVEVLSGSNPPSVCLEPSLVIRASTLSC
ncbi:MAG: LacI family DNA-binding transcriptional regulator [Actinomycetota bacterium]